MKSNFERVLDVTLEHEGGYANHPKDPGGATMRGVTQRVYTDYLTRRGHADRPVRDITEDDLRAIYRQQYWDLVHGDKLPAGVDLAVFDFAVHSGATRATQELQRVLGQRTDGALGNVTLRAIAEKDPERLIVDYCAARLAFVQRLKTWSTFGRGWTRRINDVREQALAMASAQPRLGVMAMDILEDTEQPTAWAKADPRDMAPGSTPVVKAAGVTSLGLVGTAATETAEKLEWLTKHSQTIMAIFLLMTVVGLGLTFYAQVRSIRSETPE